MKKFWFKSTFILAIVVVVLIIQHVKLTTAIEAEGIQSPKMLIPGMAITIHEDGRPNDTMYIYQKR